MDCDHWDWNKGSIVGMWYHRHVIVSVHYLATHTFTAPYLFPCMPLFSFSITFSFLLVPPVSTSTPLLPWPAHLPWKVDHSCWAAAPKCVNQYPCPTQSARPTGPQQSSRFIIGQQRFFSTVCSFCDKTEPNAFQMSHRSGADKWKWPISAIKGHHSFSVLSMHTWKHNMSI